MSAVTKKSVTEFIVFLLDEQTLKESEKYDKVNERRTIERGIGMIVLHVTYMTKPGEAGNFVAAIEEAGIDTATRAEHGCLQYDYFYTAQMEDRVLLVERWADEEALKAHTCAPHFQQLGSMKSQYVLQTELKKFVGEYV